MVPMNDNNPKYRPAPNLRKGDIEAAICLATMMVVILALAAGMMGYGL